MKKILGLVLAVVMCAAVFVGCSTPAPAASESAVPSESAAASESGSTEATDASTGNTVDKIKEAGELVLLTKLEG